jgi:hypothetical protein
MLELFLSGCRDLNPGPLVPQTNALTKLRHSPYTACAADGSVDGRLRAASGLSGLRGQHEFGAVGAERPHLAVWPAGELPAAFVTEHMVPAAQQHQVPEIGRAALHPVPDVVGVAPTRSVAPRKHAALVPHDEAAPLSRGHHSGAATEIEHRVRRVERVERPRDGG